MDTGIMSRRKTSARARAWRKPSSPRLTGQENPTVSLHCDKSVAFDEVVAMMRMAKANNFTLIAATSPE